MKRTWGLSFAACGLVWGGEVLAAETGWPRAVSHPEAEVLIYQPQVSLFTADDIEARAAVQLTVPGRTEAYFGAVWITARVETDRDARLVSFRDIRIPTVRFPDGSEEDKQKLASFLEEEIPKWELDMSLDELIPLLDVAEHEELKDTGLKHGPPAIVVSREPATLVFIEGEPRRQPVTEPRDAARAKLERVINTPVIHLRPQAKSVVSREWGRRLVHRQGRSRPL
jgi:hypothetical protein